MESKGKGCECTECCYGCLVKLYQKGTEIPLTSIAVNTEFDIFVKALEVSAYSSVASSTATTLTLRDAQNFSPSGGSGYLKESPCRKFSWTGKNGDQLTGVTGHDDPVAAGTTAVFIRTGESVETSCDTTFSIIASGGGDLDQEGATSVTLNNKTITLSGGIATLTTKVTSEKFKNDQKMFVALMQQTAPSKGRCGTAVTTFEGESTWYFRNIAFALNQRSDELNLSASSLSTTTPDTSITYTEVNAARAAIEAMGVNATFRKSDSANDFPKYSDRADLLDAAGVGGGSPTTWRNKNGGSWVYRDQMQSGDTMCNEMYEDLVNVTKIMLYTGQTAGQEITTDTSNYGTFFESDDESTQDAAWEGRFDSVAGNANDAFKIDLHSWTGPDRYKAQIQGYTDDTWVEVTDITSPASTLSKSISFYIRFSTYTGNVGYYDFLGFGTTADDTYATTPIATTTTTANSYRTGDIIPQASKWSRPPTWESKRLTYNSGAVWAEIKWTFPMDTNLGSPLWKPT